MDQAHHVQVVFFLLVVTRIFVAMLFFPLAGQMPSPSEGRHGMPVCVSLAISVVMSGLYVVFEGGAPPLMEMPGMSRFLIGLLWEAAVGGLMGCLFGGMLQVFGFWGQLIDQTVLPGSTIHSAATYRPLLSIVFIAVFLSTGGWETFVGGFFLSLRALPVASGYPLSFLNDSAVITIVGYFSSIFLMALTMALPCLLAAIVTELVIGVANRAIGGVGGGLRGAGWRLIVVQVVLVGTVWKSYQWGMEVLSEQLGLVAMFWVQVMG